MKYEVSEVSAEEKLRLLAGKDVWHTEDLNGKLYRVTVSDGPLGLRKCAQRENGEWYDVPAVAYPSAEVLSQTWNPALAYRLGECLADECTEQKVDILLAPGVNIKRSPLCGRNFEYFSEDPLVAGIFGREYIRGVQSKHVGTSLKHYCANNLEFGRLWTSSEADERTLREIYLQPFRIACEADPATVMCSYNLVNGQRMSENGKLYRVLRKEFWREDGVIVSDWGAVKDRAASVRAGLDIEMPYSEEGYRNLKDAYDRKELSEAEIDACAARVLRLISRCEEESKLRKVSSTREERLLAAQNAAEEGVVLLKNNGALPLADGAEILLAGIDPDAYYSGGGSSRVQTAEPPKTLKLALQEELPHSRIHSYGMGNWWDREYLPAFEEAYEKDVAIVVCGDSESEGNDRHSMKLSAGEEMLILETARINPNTVVVLHCGAAIDMSAWIGKVGAVVWAGYGGERGNEALAGILGGRVNPSGKLTETFACSYEEYPVAKCYRDHAVNVYSEGLLVGYRYFDRHPEKVLFPFGYGLSYAHFEYSGLSVEKEGEEYCVRFRIRNDSGRDGAEIAQVYVREVHSRVFRPFKELKGFEKVFVKANETKTVCVRLSKDAFAYYSVARDCWTVTPGKFEIFVAKNAREICLQTTISVL